MQFNVAQLLKEAVGSLRRYAVDEEMEDGRVVGEISLLRTDRGILASVRAEVPGHWRCSRCLAEIDHTVMLNFEEEFYTTIDVNTGAPLPPPEEADAFLIDSQHMLALGEALRQYQLTAEPMAPLCRPDCRGLCPRCGQNLNLGPCACPPEADPRWMALESLKGRWREGP